MKMIFNAILILITGVALSSCSGGYVSTGTGVYGGYDYPSSYWHSPGPEVRFYDPYYNGSPYYNNWNYMHRF